MDTRIHPKFLSDTSNLNTVSKKKKQLDQALKMLVKCT